MTDQRLLAVFAENASAVRAIRALRERGHTRIEAYSPAPDDALEAALGSPSSPIHGFTLIGGLIGCASGLALTVWTSLELPLVTGGKPIVSLPPYLIIAYESTILLAALATFAGFLIHTGLPRLQPVPWYDPRFSQDRCGVLVTTTADEALAARELLASAGAEEVRGV